MQSFEQHMSDAVGVHSTLVPLAILSQTNHILLFQRGGTGCFRPVPAGQRRSCPRSPDGGHCSTKASAFFCSHCAALDQRPRCDPCSGPARRQTSSLRTGKRCVEIMAVLDTRVETVLDPKVESVFHPRVKVVFDPKVETVLDPGVETILDPKVETELDPRVETVLDTKVETVLDPRVETVLDTKVETVFHPRVKTVFDQKVETVLDPGVETILDPRVGSKLSQKNWLDACGEKKTILVDEQPGRVKSQNNNSAFAQVKSSPQTLHQRYNRTSNLRGLRISRSPGSGFSSTTMSPSLSPSLPPTTSTPESLFCDVMCGEFCGVTDTSEPEV